MARTIILLILWLTIQNCSAQPPQYKLVGGPCEGCEAIFEFGDKVLNSVDTLPDFGDKGLKIRISGTVYKADGLTPAAGVILYIYHTDQTGVYPKRGNEKGWARRHGYIRGWVKTGEDGQYAFYTLKPGTYPNRSEPAHIHLTVLEPDGKYYWLGSYHFEGDPLLTSKETNPESPRGGYSGIVKLEQTGDFLTGQRNLILGKNIPDYQ